MIPENVLQLFKEANERSIQYLHWKSNEHLLAGLEGLTDLDVLIKNEQYGAFVDLLRKYGYIRVKSIKWQEYPNVEDWIGLCMESGKQTHIHLHRKLITGKTYVKEQHLPFEEVMFATRVCASPDIYVADPNLEIIILLIRIVIKQVAFRNNGSYRFKDSVRKEYEYLKQRINRSTVKAYLVMLFPDKMQELFLSIIFDSCTNERMRELKACVIGYLKSERKISDWRASFLSIARYYYIKARYHFHIPLNTKKTLYDRQGMIITLLGVDGAGKTTVAKKIQKELCWKIDFRYYYLGTGDGSANWLNRVLRYYSNNKKKKYSGSNKENVGETKKKGPTGIKLLVANFNSLLNARAKYRICKEMNKLRQQGGIAITDRYPQMQYAGINDGIHVVDIGTGLFSVVNKIIQKKESDYISRACQYLPDMVLKLVIPYEVSRARKQDSSEDSIRQKMKIVDALHYQYAEEYILDNSCELEDTILKVKKIIWEKMKETITT